MGYENKPGFGNLFQNKKKKSDKEPAMRGEVVTPSGELLEIAGWSKTDKNGGKFLSLKLQKPREQRSGGSEEQAAPQKSQSAPQDMDDEIPW